MWLEMNVIEPGSSFFCIKKGIVREPLHTGYLNYLAWQVCFENKLLLGTHPCNTHPMYQAE
jgi:hypothetical protein